MGTLQRIKQFINYIGFTNQKFEKIVGFSNGAFSSQLRNNKTIGVDKLENILSKFPELNPEWLLTGRGHMLREKNIITGEAFSNQPPNLIPLYDGTIVTDNPAPESIYSTDAHKYINAGDWFGDATAAMRVHDNSMPQYPTGSIVAMKEVFDTTLIVYGQDYGIETSEYRIIRRLQKGKSNSNLLLSADSSERWDDGTDKGRLIHEPFSVAAENIKKLYLVLGCIKRNIII